MKTKSPSTHKKVVVETFEGERLAGYINPRHFDRPEGLEMLNAAGELVRLPWAKVKLAWFVRDWEEVSPRTEPLAFARRPRLAGLWVRLRFRDAEEFEGIVVNDLLHLSEHGYVVTPPDLNGNLRNAFVPRAALASMEVLSVIPNRGAHLGRRRPPTAAPTTQRELFKE